MRVTETYEYLDRIRAVLNIDITVIKPEKDGRLLTWSRLKKLLMEYLPSISTTEMVHRSFEASALNNG